MFKKFVTFTFSLLFGFCIILPVSSSAASYHVQIEYDRNGISPRAVIPYCHCTGAPSRMIFEGSTSGYCPSCGTSSHPLATTALIYDCSVCHSQVFIDELGHSLVNVVPPPTPGTGNPYILEPDSIQE